MYRLLYYYSSIAYDEEDLIDCVCLESSECVRADVHNIDPHVAHDLALTQTRLRCSSSLSYSSSLEKQ